ncbi:protein FAM166B-like [Pollicipes pollicipes]|uniref:protein FAM166B-like n=1 Tax=Pollicipes pollicipes TaxID=41117 RepID=UPI0018858217|nr:protein FAM166B-like [Pollicipes pollicipes]
MPPRKEDGKLSPLITPDPHYIPGYQGHVPGFLFDFGATFGHMSNKLLTDPCIPGSGNLVRPLNFNVGRSDPSLGPLVRSSGCNFPRLTTNMVPGFSGRIPAYDNVFGLSYARGTEKAIRDFECNQVKARQQRQHVNALAAMNTCNTGRSGYNANCPVPLWSP